MAGDSDAERSSSEWSDSEDESPQTKLSSPHLKPPAAVEQVRRPPSFPTHLINRQSGSNPHTNEEDASEDDEEDLSHARANEPELDMINALRKEIKSLPMFKLEEMRKNGVHGVPLHKALGKPIPAPISFLRRFNSLD